VRRWVAAKRTNRPARTTIRLSQFDVVSAGSSCAGWRGMYPITVRVRCAMRVCPRAPLPDHAAPHPATAARRPSSARKGRAENGLCPSGFRSGGIGFRVRSDSSPGLTRGLRGNDTNGNRHAPMIVIVREGGRSSNHRTREKHDLTSTACSVGYWMPRLRGA